MKRNLPVVLALLMVIVAPRLAQCEAAVESWVRRYNNLVDASDHASQVATDNSGNVIVAGTTDEGVTGPDILIIKYSSSGTPLWTNRYNGSGNSTDQPVGLAVDGSGNVVVSGYSHGLVGSWNYVTLKYSSVGAALWTNTYNGPANYDDYAIGLALDSSGNVFVAGYSDGIGTSADYTTLKYSAAGVALWTNRYNGPGNSGDYANGVAVDGSGNVYVTGTSDSGTSYDYATVAYSSSGGLLWVNRYNGPGNDDDEATAIAIAGSDVFITGYSFDGSHDYDYATIKYSSAGLTLWTNRYNGPADYDDQAWAVKVSGTNVYVTGVSHSANSGDYTTIKYSTTGVPLWTNRYDGPANSYDEAFGLAVDGSGNVLVTGYSYGVDTWSDYATVAYAGNGTVLWATRYNGPRGDGSDYAASMATDNSGNVFVTGRSGGITSDDWATLKYSNAGAALWTNRYNGFSKSECYPMAVTADVSGNIIVTGHSRGNGTSTDYATVKYSSTGVALWTNRYTSAGYAEDEAQAVKTDTAGNVYVTGFGAAISGGPDYVTIKYSGAGIAAWTNRYNGQDNMGDFVKGLAVDATGKVFVTGTSERNSGGSDYLTIAYSTAGAPLWTNRFGGGYGSDQAQGIVVDTGGNVIVTGYASSETNGEDFVTIKYSGAGAVLWTNRYNGPGNSADIAQAVALDASGNVIVTGYSNDTNGYNFATIKYSIAGVPLWTNRYIGPAFGDDVPQSLATDGSGNVYVTGFSPDNAGDDDYATVKYSSAGTPLWTNRYDGPGSGDDYANGVALDSSGRVYVSGYSFSGGGTNGFDFAIVAYSSSGVPLWTNRYNGPFNGDDRLLTSRSMAVIGDGSLVVVGESPGRYSANGAHDFTTVSYITVPELRIRRVTASSSAISWDSPSTGFVLQERTNLTTAAWTFVSATPTDDGTNKTLTVSSPLGTRFYRLVKP